MEKALEWFSKLKSGIVNNGITSHPNVPIGDITLTSSQSHVLLLGSRFIPTPRNGDFDLNVFYKDLDIFARRLRLRAFYFNPNKPSPPHRQKLFSPLYPVARSNWNPTGSPDYNRRLVEPYLERTCTLIKHIINTNSTPATRFILRRNLTNADWLALHSLRNSKNVILRNADKNLGLVAIDREIYLQAASRILQDRSTYSPLTSDFLIYQTRSQIIQELQSKEAKEEFEEKTLKWAISETQAASLSPPALTLLPKIHKTPLAWRSIVCAHSAITTPLSTLIAHWLNANFIPLIHTLINDSLTLLQRIDKLHLSPYSSYWLVTLDIQDFYPTIPIDPGVDTVRDFIYALMDQQILHPGYERFIRWLRFILKRSFLSFNNQNYHQIKGTAQGTNCAPPFANLYFASHELAVFSREILIDETDAKVVNNAQRSPRTLTTNGGVKIVLYARLLDDIFMIVEGSHSQAEKAVAEISQHPHLRFTSKIGHTADVLDLSLRLTHTNNIISSTYQKQISRFLYIPFRSYHLRSTQQAWIKAEILRHARNCNRYEDYVSLVQLFYDHLRARGFPKQFLLPIFTNINYSRKREELLSLNRKNKESRTALIPFTTRLHPWLRRFRLNKLLQQHSSLLPKDFRIVVGWKNPPTIGDKLIHSRLGPPEHKALKLSGDNNNNKT